MLNTHGRYSYAPITARPGLRWPNGARLAVYVALGIEEYLFGEGLTEDILPGTPKPDLVNTSWRDYGNRVGGFRLLDRLASLGIAPAVLLNTEIYDHAPALMAAARAAGAEIVAHGNSNSDTLHGMEPAEEGAYIREVADAIERAEGAAPAGWSSPWLAHTELTLRPPGRGRISLCPRSQDGRPAGLAHDAAGPAPCDPLCARAQRQFHHHRPARRAPTNSRR